MAYLLLAGAIVLEVMATINLRLSEGFTRLVPSVLVVIGYLGAFGLLSQVLAAGVPVGVAYGIWAAAGVALVAIIGAVLLGDTLTPVQFGGIALVVAGVLTLELGAAH
ncbi:DMT family transporter [Pseudonocardia parietis]|uniref:Small multidrug resistance pump n=1 Tax=Pseudonocardia parietis TaxID=570936 RepID=A0ABS4VUP2_9PSEU|nr:multidrug efflux SMR transporter [Pseudonocardia parietis]MBP2367511.1 small multidrug resistance pump [Pseudonocardia parietis]